MMRKLLYSFLFFISSKSFYKRLSTPSLGLLCVGMFFVFSTNYGQCGFGGSQYGTTQSIIYNRDNVSGNIGAVTFNNVPVGRYVGVNVIQGLTYTITATSNQSFRKRITLFNPSNASVGTADATSNNGNVSINWTASFTGTLLVRINNSTNCNSTAGNNSTITVSYTGGNNTVDQVNANAEGNNSWIAHVYDFSDTASVNPLTDTNAFTNGSYLGYFLQPNTITGNTTSFSQDYGGGLTPNVPFIATGSGSQQLFYGETFAVRYRMRSTLPKGCYFVTVRGDDGVRLFVDGVKVFDAWVQQGPTEYTNVLVYLNGNSQLQLDYYDKDEANVTDFSIYPADDTINSVNGINTAGPVYRCAGSNSVLDGSAITYQGSNTNPSIKFQWQSSPDNVSWTDIGTNGTSENYTVPATNPTSQTTVYYRRNVTGTASNAGSCTYSTESIAVITSVNTNPTLGTTITGTASQCPAVTGQVYSITTTNATSFNWAVPLGWTITSGQGTNSITVTTGTAGGTISVTATNGCAGRTATRNLAVTMNANNTVVLNSATGTDAQTRCINTAITNIRYNTTGATGATVTGLPAGVTGSWAANVVTISGAPTVSSATPYSYTVTLNGGCGTVTATGTITVNPNNTVSLTSAAGTDAQTACINTPITNITYSTTGATSATVTGLPSGVTGGWSGNVVTISGTPTVSSATPYSYTVTLNGGCGTVTATGTIRVNPNNTVSLTSATGTNGQTSCINTPIANITYSTTGATSATVTGLPAGVTGGWSGNVVTISGAPTVSSATPYSYTVTLNGGCGTVTATGTIRVNPNNTVSLTSAAGTDAQTACINTPITNITYSTTGATSATVTGLPAGVTGGWSGNVVTISGTPTVSSATPYSYTVTLNGGCGTVTATGTIRVNPINTITLTSAAGTDAQSICFNSAITDITYATTGGSVVMTSGFPTGLNIAWSGSVLRISGTPNVSSASPYNYTVALQGNCATVTLSGTITVKPLPATPTITKNNDAACNTLGSITIAGLSGNWTVNQTGATTLPKSYSGPGVSLAIQDLVADTYSFTVTNNDTGCVSSAVTVTITDTSSNTDWGPSGWTNGEPDGSKSVTISSLANGQPFSLAKPNIDACSLTITVGSDVIIPSGVTLTITNKVTSNGKLVFESGSSLIQTTNVQNSGDIVYKRATSIRRFDLTYWSSPITSTKQDGFMMKDLSPETLFDKYSYWSSSFKWATDLYGNMEMKPGIGYSIRGPQSFSIETPAEFTGKFFGTPNNGDIPISTTADKYLLIGNPYPSAIDGRKFITDNGDVGALYFWTHVSLPKKAEGSNTYKYSSPDYAVFTLLGATRATTGGETPSGYIGVGQGFFIKPKVTSIKFNNGQRVKAENSQFFKTTAKEAAIEVNRLWLNLSNTDDAYKQILIGYAEGATNSFDYNYDAVTLAGNSYIDFYTINEAQKLSIQARSLPFDNTEGIPLGYKSVAETQLTISIDHADGFFNKQAVYLEDKTTGTITDLRASNYTFKTGIGTFTDRFVLRYTNKTLGTDDIENLENSVLISVKNKTVSITCSKETIKDVTIFNVGGQLVYSKNKVNSSELQITNLHSSDQVLLVKVTLENGSIITKKVIFSNL
ncbi:T9SS sorting signal type C domain-containing protein [Flavobacterium tyrosinilyticum]|uniref:T9SS sorting signal type C domain-containing protein n=1 Tax=Flavobacterium tyrosinilyticum TaxID=1658740 RepID=UPI002030476E|nr:T9SS sorting signal type C domain-containing protein [Flavobacterium tyrosinilyticum]MCM0665657.1 T9SS sorting signal type C domain-containing protein [Flavobacterium tyrosinilyticum]